MPGTQMSRDTKFCVSTSRSIRLREKQHYRCLLSLLPEELLIASFWRSERISPIFAVNSGPGFSVSKYSTWVSVNGRLAFCSSFDYVLRSEILDDRLLLLLELVRSDQSRDEPLLSASSGSSYFFPKEKPNAEQPVSPALMSANIIFTVQSRRFIIVPCIMRTGLTPYRVTITRSTAS